MWPRTPFTAGRDCIWATAAPIPPEPPVIRATLPASDITTPEPVLIGIYSTLSNQSSGRKLRFLMQVTRRLKSFVPISFEELTANEDRRYYCPDSSGTSLSHL